MWLFKNITKDFPNDNEKTYKLSVSVNSRRSVSCHRYMLTLFILLFFHQMTLSESPVCFLFGLDYRGVFPCNMLVKILANPDYCFSFFVFPKKVKIRYLKFWPDEVIEPSRIVLGSESPTSPLCTVYVPAKVLNNSVEKRFASTHASFLSSAVHCWHHVSVTHILRQMLPKPQRTDFLHVFGQAVAWITP